jgi:FKBP-type peptidyl-prolyl cis-trans isomerase FklB
LALASITIAAFEKNGRELMRQSTTLSILLMAFAATSATADDGLKLDDDNARINYSVGYQVGNDFRRQGVEIDPEIVARGIADAMSGTQPAMSSLEMRKELTDLQRRVTEARKAGAQDENEKPSQ